MGDLNLLFLTQWKPHGIESELEYKCVREIDFSGKEELAEMMKFDPTLDPNLGKSPTKARLHEEVEGEEEEEPQRLTSGVGR